MLKSIQDVRDIIILLYYIKLYDFFLQTKKNHTNRTLSRSPKISWHNIQRHW